MISVKHLSKVFGDTTVLKDVNAEIQRGEVISIIGPSGTGKSTFLRCLNLLERPTGGEVTIDGINLLDRKTDVYKLRQKMGMVSVLQPSPTSWWWRTSCSVRSTFSARTPRGLRRREAVGTVARGKAYAYPDEAGRTEQRVAIARTLAMHPEIVLFDEPTSP